MNIRTLVMTWEGMLDAQLKWRTREYTDQQFVNECIEGARKWAQDQVDSLANNGTTPKETT